MDEPVIDPTLQAAIWLSAEAQAQEQATAQGVTDAAEIEVLTEEIYDQLYAYYHDTISAWKAEHPGQDIFYDIIAGIVILETPDVTALEGDIAIEESTLKWMEASYMTVYFAMIKMINKMIQDILKVEGELRGEQIELIGASAILKAEAVLTAAHMQAGMYIAEAVGSLVTAIVITASLCATLARARVDPKVKNAEEKLNDAKTTLEAKQNELARTAQKRMQIDPKKQPEVAQRLDNEIATLKAEIGTPAQEGKPATGLYADVAEAQKGLAMARFDAWTYATQVVTPFKELGIKSVEALVNSTKATLEMVKGDWDAFKEIIDAWMRTAEQVVSTSAEETRQTHQILQALIAGLKEVAQQIHMFQSNK